MPGAFQKRKSGTPQTSRFQKRRGFRLSLRFLSVSLLVTREVECVGGKGKLIPCTTKTPQGKALHRTPESVSSDCEGASPSQNARPDPNRKRIPCYRTDLEPPKIETLNMGASWNGSHPNRGGLGPQNRFDVPLAFQKTQLNLSRPLLLPMRAHTHKPILWMDEILHHLRNPGMMIPL